MPFNLQFFSPKFGLNLTAGNAAFLPRSSLRQEEILLQSGTADSAFTTTFTTKFEFLDVLSFVVS